MLGHLLYGSEFQPILPSLRLTFDLPENTATLLPTAGCVLLQADESGPKDSKGNPITRPYTPISPSNTRGEVTFLIKKYDTGKARKIEVV